MRRLWPVLPVTLGDADLSSGHAKLSSRAHGIARQSWKSATSRKVPLLVSAALLCSLLWLLRRDRGRTSDVVFWHNDEQFFASSRPAHPLPINTTLAARLRFWKAAPVADNDRWLRYNDQACEGRTAANEVWQEVHVKLADWRATTASDVRDIRDRTIRCVLRAQASGRLLWATTADRGIVFTAGNGDTAWRVLVTARILRARGITLPIEVFHYPDETLPQDATSELQRLGASVRAISNTAIVRTASAHKNFQVRPLAKPPMVAP